LKNSTKGSKHSFKGSTKESKNGSFKKIKAMVNPIYEDEPDLTDKENLELRALRRRYGWQPNRLS
jgi:hypothetical protein